MRDANARATRVRYTRETNEKAATAKEALREVAISAKNRLSPIGVGGKLKKEKS